MVLSPLTYVPKISISQIYGYCFSVGIVLYLGVPNLKELIKNKLVSFDFYRAGVVYYTVRDDANLTWRFPVRLDDIGDATLLAHDKAILFMRYIRKAIESNELHKV